MSKAKSGAKPKNTPRITAAPAPADATKKIHLSVVLDKSGSMKSTQIETISGLNDYIHTLQNDKESDYTVTLTQFDSPVGGPELTVSYADKPIAEVPDLTMLTYQPRGGTPLYDAIGECIRRTEPVHASGQAIIMLIVTDGEENSSKEFNRNSIKDLRTRKEADGWTFVFLGADIDSYAIGSSLGLSLGSTANYAKGKEAQLYRGLADATMMRSASIRNIGVQASAATDFLDDITKSAFAPDNDTLGAGRSPAAPAGFLALDPLVNAITDALTKTRDAGKKVAGDLSGTHPKPGSWKVTRPKP